MPIGFHTSLHHGVNFLKHQQKSSNEFNETPQWFRWIKGKWSIFSICKEFQVIHLSEINVDIGNSLIYCIYCLKSFHNTANIKQFVATAGCPKTVPLSFQYRYVGINQTK